MASLTCEQYDNAKILLSFCIPDGIDVGGSGVSLGVVFGNWVAVEIMAAAKTAVGVVIETLLAVGVGLYP
jgi:hypothetical protein